MQFQLSKMGKEWESLWVSNEWNKTVPNCVESVAIKPENVAKSVELSHRPSEEYPDTHAWTLGEVSDILNVSRSVRRSEPQAAPVFWAQAGRLIKVSDATKEEKQEEKQKQGFFSLLFCDMNTRATQLLSAWKGKFFEAF